jgi:hypothetical protein
MKTLVLLPLLLAAAASAQAPADLVGTWQVDLRPTPDAAPSLQPLVVTAADEDGIEGTFYGSPIQRAEVNTRWDGVHVAFETSDGSARYVTVAHLTDDGLEGVTYAPDRGLLQPWRAERGGEN